MSDLQRQLRVINEHNSDGTHNAKAATTLKTLFPASATPTANTIPISDGSGKLDGWVTVALTKYFESAEQTITSAGSLTLAHGLGVEPKLFQVMLICKTAEHNYSVGDKVSTTPSQESGTAANDYGVSIVPNSTNLDIRYGSQPATFIVLNKTTGVAVLITNTNWKAIFRAWA